MILLSWKRQLLPPYFTIHGHGGGAENPHPERLSAAPPSLYGRSRKAAGRGALAAGDTKSSTERGARRGTGVKTPIYRFMLLQQFSFCFPPKPYALAALVTWWKRKQSRRHG